MAQGHPGHHPEKTPAKGQGDEHDQQNVGDAQKQVDAPGEDRVRPPAQGGGHPAEQGDDRAHQGGEYADADGQGQPGQGAGEHVPSHPVGAEQKGEAGGAVHAGEVGLHGLLGEQSAGHRDRQEHRQGEKQEQEGPLPTVELSHDLATPLRILGSTAP